MWESKTFKNQEFVPLIKFLAELYQPEVYCEIGTQRGFTFNQIAPLVPTAIGVDIKMQASVLRADNTVLLETDSWGLLQHWELTPTLRKLKFADLVLIDANHECHQVLADVNCVKNIIRPGTGLILLHDTYPSNENLTSPGYCHNAWKAADIIFKDREKYGDFEIVTLPGPYAGLSVLRLRGGNHLHWMGDYGRTEKD